jgi:hypothetical protein
MSDYGAADLRIGRVAGLYSDWLVGVVLRLALTTHSAAIDARRYSDGIRGCKMPFMAVLRARRDRPHASTTNHEKLLSEDTFHGQHS